MSDPHPPPAALAPELLERAEALVTDLEPLVLAQEERRAAVPYEDRRRSENARGWLQALQGAQQALEYLLDAVHFGTFDDPPPQDPSELEAAVAAMREGWRWADEPAVRVLGKAVVLALDAPGRRHPPRLFVYRAGDVIAHHRRQLEREAELGRPLAEREALEHWEALEEPAGASEAPGRAGREGGT